jgi:hypothetical protein
LNEHELRHFQNSSIKRSLRRWLFAVCIAAALMITLASCASAEGLPAETSDETSDETSENEPEVSSKSGTEQNEVMTDDKQRRKYLRRADSIFFGSLPFTYTVSQIGFSIYENIEQGNRPFSSLSFSEESFSQRTLIATVSLSAAFSLADFIIEKSRQENDE